MRNFLTRLLNDTDDDEKYRKEFLLRMYDQMLNDINRHIIVIWQSVGIIVAAFAVFPLVEKNIIPIDIACSLIVLISGWVIANIYDSSYWYNRNLAIISNIERIFLKKSDQHEVHYYFGKHRKPGEMLFHLKIQLILALAIGLLFLMYHLIGFVLPGIGKPWANFEILKTFPYLAFLACFIYIAKLRARRNRDYIQFLKNSPGTKIDTTGIAYGSGHPVQ